MVPDRNNQFIFVQIEYLFLANMMLNGVWLIVFTQDTKRAFLLGFVIIIALLFTCIRIMMLSCRAEFNTFEAIVIRGGFSFYAGWVTAATALNFMYWQKQDNDLVPPEDEKYQLEKENKDHNEAQFSIKVLYFVALWYTAWSIEELNPLYGLVLLWTLKAIEVNQRSKNIAVANKC